MATAYDDRFAASAWPVLLATHGQSVTYHLSGEDDLALTAIFTPDRSDLIDIQPGGRDDSRTGSLQVAKTDLASPSTAAKVTIGGALWHVVTIDDGGSFWTLNLRRDVSIERAPEPFRMLGG